MTDKQLRRLGRSELLELLIEQSREIDRLTEELSKAREALSDRELKTASAGSLAEAAAAVNDLLLSAQKTADQYLWNMRKRCGIEEETDSGGQG